MWKTFFLALAGSLLVSAPAMALCTSYPNPLTNGTTADGSQVIANFNCAQLTDASSFQVGTVGTPPVPTTTPNTISLGNTYSSAAGLYPKLHLFNDGTSLYGLGVSSVEMDFTIPSSANYAFFTVASGSPTQLLKIQNNGIMQLSGSSAGYYTYDRTGSGAQSAFYMMNSTTAALWIGGGNIITFQNTGDAAVMGCLTYNGGTLGTCLSDERVKKDIRPFTSVGLKEVTALEPVVYRFNGRGGTDDDGNVRNGLVAQQVRSVAPELVTVRKVKLNAADDSTTDLLAVNYGAIEFALINSVKELKALDDRQAAQIRKLERQVAAIKRQKSS